MANGGAVTSVLQMPGLTTLGPAGQIAWGPGDVQEPAIWLKVLITGDGTTGTLTVNWIDGVQTLPFTPSCVLAFMGVPIPGGATAGILGVEGSLAAANRVSAVTNVSFGLSITTGITGGNSTCNVFVAVYK